MAENFPRFVSAGEALTDMIRIDGDSWSSKTGGSIWNVARAAARLGVASAFAGSISRCCFGDALWSDSETAGLDLRFLQRVDRPPLLAIVPQSHPPHYFFIGNDSADLYFTPQALPPGWREHAEWVHFGSISLARQPLAGRLLELAEELHEAGVPISYDPNYRNIMDKEFLPVFEKMCRLADVIKLSDEDLAGLMGSDCPRQTLEEIRRWHPDAWWLYTEGPRGATLFTPQGAWQATPPAITVADTVGAGDACAAGLIASRLSAPDESPQRHLARAVAAGTAACQHAGATPPTQASVSALIHGIQVRQLI